MANLEVVDHPVGGRGRWPGGRQRHQRNVNLEIKNTDTINVISFYIFHHGTETLLRQTFFRQTFFRQTFFHTFGPQGGVRELAPLFKAWRT